MSDTLVADTPALKGLTGIWLLDPTHSSMGFAVRHAMVSTVRGSFDHFAGDIIVNAHKPEKSFADVTIDVASISTGNEDRDEHLCSSDFFDVATFPVMTFVSTKITDKGDFLYEVTGDLTIKDVTRSVTFPMEFTGAATDPYGTDRIGFEGSLIINRKDWGLNWNTPMQKGAGLLVGDNITIQLDVALIKD